MEDNKAGLLLAVVSLAILIAAFFMLRSMDDPAPMPTVSVPINPGTTTDTVTVTAGGLRSEMPEPQERSPAAADDVIEIPIPAVPPRPAISVPEPSVDAAAPARIPLQIPLPDGTIVQVRTSEADDDTP